MVNESNLPNSVFFYADSFQICANIGHYLLLLLCHNDCVHDDAKWWTFNKKTYFSVFTKKAPKLKLILVKRNLNNRNMRKQDPIMKIGIVL